MHSIDSNECQSGAPSLDGKQVSLKGGGTLISPSNSNFTFKKVTQEESLKTGKRQMFIPRITLVEEKTFGFKLHRKQFPVKLAFAMSINKSQGQTLDFAGLDLRRDVFSHGQLYVGLSRVRSWDCMKVRVHEDNNDGTVKNEVWQELL